MQYFDYYHSPLGKMLLVASDTALTGVHFVDEKYYPGIAADWQQAPSATIVAQAREQLNQYFAGKLSEFDLPVDPDGTAFQRGVWRELKKIPYGTTINYGTLARRIGNSSASRAVGAANAHNPISIVIPCHRVIGANGDLTGYAGGMARKEALLRLETRRVEDLQLAPDQCIAERLS